MKQGLLCANSLCGCLSGQPTQQDKSKQIALKEWVDAVNQDGRFGKWANAVSNHPKDIEDVIDDAVKQ